MIDVSGALNAAASARGDWGPDVAVPVVERIIKGSGLVVDWDDGAGEEWMTLLRNGEQCVLVGARLPLAFVLKAEELAWQAPVVVVDVPSLTRPMLRCSRSTLEAVFGQEFKAMEFYPSGFSVLDLAATTM